MHSSKILLLLKYEFILLAILKKLTMNFTLGTDFHHNICGMKKTAIFSLIRAFNASYNRFHLSYTDASQVHNHSFEMTFDLFDLKFLSNICFLV